MASVSISKKDVFWSYLATFFQLASGLITLPFILAKLSADEVGLNYLMITVGTLVSLFDFGFAPQFGRNFSYILGGAQELKKEGVATNMASDVNYRLLAVTISVARRVYRRISGGVLLIMLTVGTIYIYKVTDGYSLVDNSLLIWIIYCFSTFFNLYYTYYSSLLTGAGKVMEAKKAMLASRIAGIILTLGMLYAGLGLLSVVISNLISPFISRFLSYRFFYTNEMKDHLNGFEISESEKKSVFAIIWYNAKKLGLVFIGSYAINKFGMFLAGLFLSLEDVGSYGLMIQLFSILTSVSLCYYQTEMPELASLRVENREKRLVEKFSLSMLVYYMLFLLGAFAIAILGPFLLRLIGSASRLPATSILVLYALVVFLENNHSAFANFIVTGNSVPFVAPSLITGGFIILISYLSLRFTPFGILGLVVVQGTCQLVYNNWKWPFEVLRMFKLSPFSFLKEGVSQMEAFLSSYSSKLKNAWR